LYDKKTYETKIHKQKTLKQQKILEITNKNVFLSIKCHLLLSLLKKAVYDSN